MTPPGRSRLTLAGVALLTATLVPGLATLPALAGPGIVGATPAAPVDADAITTLGDPVPGLSDLDARGRALPSATQRSAATRLGAVDMRWNQFGTPASLLPADGSLGTATSSNPVAAARAWLNQNRAVFGLGSEQVTNLELVNNAKFAQSSARAVLFRQKFGNLAPALDSMVTVGVANGQIAYASSSIAKTTDTAPAAVLGATEAWVAAAENIGREVGVSEVDDVTDEVGADGWTRLRVPGFAQEQQVRLRSLAKADGEVRPVFETNVVDVENGATLAYTSMVDAVTGEVLHRQNQVHNSNDAIPFQGSVDGTACAGPHEFELTDGETEQIEVVAVAANTANDIVIKLYKGDTLLAEGDLLTSPETLTYTPGGKISEGVYNVRICPFEGTPFLPPTNYAGNIFTSDTPGAAPEVPFPAWRYFPANPTLNWSPSHTPKNNEVGCWKIRGRGDQCTLPSGQLDQIGAEMWDYSFTTDTPTLTSLGNNAETREAWGSPLTPGGFGQAPISPTRDYLDDFTDAWNNEKCSPANLTPAGNDIFAATTNLFVGHNRFHDYSYGLGFTELNYNLQRDNRSKNPDPTRDNDPEIGNVQAGAASGGAPSYLGRDNANQIALQDGVPGITNQYLFQPIAGAFYAPCADGSLDTSILGHEYTHAITNRMIGGPDQGIGSEQGGAMGESWGDLVAAEYMFSHGYPTGANPWAVGPYATGNGQAGIRDYAINRNPLNYSNYGFDSTGPEVHADGEIWNAAMWNVRQALVNRWDFGIFRYDNLDRQLRCAEGSPKQGPLKATRCPGNRRWVALMFDSYLLQQSATSMLDARDAFLAADRMRFGNGKNQKPIWDAFAKSGMGAGASTPNADSSKPKASFVSPRSSNGTVTFRTSGSGKVFVGDYEARSAPVADTIGKSKMDAKAKFAPGSYPMLYVSEKQGFKRFTLRVASGQNKTVQVSNPRNLAAKASGGKVIGESPSSRNAVQLIDGTESSNWGGVNDDGANVDERSPFVSVDLAGGVHQVRKVNVSAMLVPAATGDDPVPVAQIDEDPDSGSRFTALRKFALDACVSNCSSDGATWRRFFVSKDNAFPSVRPRPVVPNLIMRSFDVRDTRAAAIRIVALENQCTGFKGYAGEQDNDPLNATDCKTASDRGSIVHAAELQVF